MWRKYAKEETLIPDTRKHMRTLFIDVVKSITKGDVKIRACVDYILNALAFENFANLRNVVERKIFGAVNQKYYMTKLDGVRD